MCFPRRREAYFQKNHENKWSESEKWSRKTLDGKCDGYACAVLVTCKSMKIENVLRTLGRKHFFEGDKFGVYSRFNYLRIHENRNYAPHNSRKHNFAFPSWPQDGPKSHQKRPRGFRKQFWNNFRAILDSPAPPKTFKNRWKNKENQGFRLFPRALKQETQKAPTRGPREAKMSPRSGPGGPKARGHILASFLGARGLIFKHSRRPFRSSRALRQTIENTFRNHWSKGLVSVWPRFAPTLETLALSFSL